MFISRKRKLASLMGSVGLVAIVIGCSTSQDNDVHDKNTQSQASSKSIMAADYAPPAESAAEEAVISYSAPPNSISINKNGIIIRGEQTDNKEAEPSYRYQPSIDISSVKREDRETYDGKEVSNIKRVRHEPVSTFAVDVDTGSYANARRFLTNGNLPPAEAVRTEEMINYFRYDYKKPTNKSQPFSVNTDSAIAPWNPNHKLVRVGLRGYDLDHKVRPAANLVFLIDVSGSMDEPNKLPLVKSTLTMLASQMRKQDRMSIVVYAGNAGVVLEPTSDKSEVKAALSRLNAGGSTAGGEGLELAYALARKNMRKNAVNRIIVATDGDFNVGISDRDALVKFVEKNRDDGITLTTLGFGTGNYNEALMEQIANVGNGNYAYIDSALEAQKVMKEELSSTLFTIAKDVKIQIEFNPAYVSQYRLIGYENRLLSEEDFDNDAIDAGDIGAGHQVTAIYEIVPSGVKGWLPERRYKNEGSEKVAQKNGEMAYIKLRYKLPKENESKLIQFALKPNLLTKAAMPKGDMAFAVAVGAFGQKLRGDKYLGNYSFDDISALAGEQNQYWRKEFIKLASLASERK